MTEQKFTQIKYADKGIAWSNYPDLCKSCGFCIDRCPQKCLSFDKERKNYLGTSVVQCDIDKCISCHICENVCPECAILVEGKK
jgi:2-oxoglutarate ferredoxin oxidoreductase subunit delta